MVEDDTAIRFLRRRELEKRFPGCAVTECDGGEAARQLASGQTFDAVLTDYKLPDLTGTELITELRRLGLVCPILMVTGSDDPEVHRAALDAGATEVLSGSRPAFAEALVSLLPGSSPS